MNKRTMGPAGACRGAAFLPEEEEGEGSAVLDMEGAEKKKERVEWDG